MSYKDHLRLFLLTGCAALVAVNCADGTEKQTLESDAEQRVSDSRDGEGKRREAGESDRERRKVWSGISYAAQTYVQLTPSESLATSGFDSERVWGGGDDWEPAVAADPGGQYVYQMTTRYGGANPVINFRRSVDGGATWETDQAFAANSADPMVEVADDGTVYTLGIVGNNWELWLRRSFDNGVTLEDPPIDVLGSGPNSRGDRPVLVVSPDGQDVYVGYNWNESFVVASHDGGATFDAPVQTTSSDGRIWFHTGGAVAPNGDVYFAVSDWALDYVGPIDIYVMRSTDGGANWTMTFLDTSTEAPECPPVYSCYVNYVGSEVGLAIDVNGLIMITYNAGDVEGQPQKLWARTSSDDGATWSGRTEIPTGATGVNNAFPAIVASRTVPGDFRVVWQDDREGNMAAWNTWMVNTLDGGASWSESELLSDLDAGAPYKGPLGYAFAYGEYIEIAIDDLGTNHIIWGAGISYNGPGGSWYTRGIPMPEPAAAFQLLAGVTLLAALARRRSA